MWVLALAMGVVASACDNQGQAPASCNRLGPGDFTCMINNRTYLVHVPPSYTGATPVPLVVDAHGLGSTAQQQMAISGWRTKADQEGFVVAYPQGVDNAFNGQGACCAFNNPQDDVTFFQAIVVRVVLAANIDQGKIFGTGLSNGGSMTQTIACESADLFVAVAPVSFQLSGGGDTIPGTVANCNPARPVAVVHFHGTADTIVPYDTGVLDSLGSLDSLAAWQMIQSCDPVNVDTRFTSNTVCERHSNCNGGAFVSLCTVQGGPHVLYNSVATTGMSIPDIAYPMFLEFAAIDPR